MRAPRLTGNQRRELVGVTVAIAPARVSDEPGLYPHATLRGGVAWGAERELSGYPVPTVEGERFAQDPFLGSWRSGGGLPHQRPNPAIGDRRVPVTRQESRREIAPQAATRGLM
jgi:hypothetical protein